MCKMLYGEAGIDPRVDFANKMVCEVSADVGHVGNLRDVVHGKLCGGTDAREFQDMRTVYSTCTEKDFGAGADEVACGRKRTGRKFNADGKREGARCVEDDLRNVLTSCNAKIRSSQNICCKICSSSGRALTIFGDESLETDGAICASGGVDVVDAIEASLSASVEECGGDAAEIGVADLPGAGCAVCFEIVRGQGDL